MRKRKKIKGSEEKLIWPEALNFESITGQGVKAIICNKEVIVGNKSLMLEQGIAIPVEAEETLAETTGLLKPASLYLSIKR